MMMRTIDRDGRAARRALRARRRWDARGACLARSFAAHARSGNSLCKKEGRLEKKAVCCVSLQHNKAKQSTGYFGAAAARTGATCPWYVCASLSSSSRWYRRARRARGRRPSTLIDVTSGMWLLGCVCCVVCVCVFVCFFDLAGAREGVFSAWRGGGPHTHTHTMQTRRRCPPPPTRPAHIGRCCTKPPTSGKTL